VFRPVTRSEKTRTPDHLRASELSLACCDTPQLFPFYGIGALFRPCPRLRAREEGDCPEGAPTADGSSAGDVHWHALSLLQNLTRRPASRSLCRSAPATSPVRSWEQTARVRLHPVRSEARSRGMRCGRCRADCLRTVPRRSDTGGRIAIRIQFLCQHEYVGAGLQRPDERRNVAVIRQRRHHRMGASASGLTPALCTASHGAVATVVTKASPRHSPGQPYGARTPYVSPGLRWAHAACDQSLMKGTWRHGPRAMHPDVRTEAKR
jgi:hypothetical protein